MNKELPLNERIQKLFESGWVNEFNYLENQLQEARYLLTCLNEKYTQSTNNWNELEDILKIKKARMLNEPDYSKYYLEGYETAIQTTHSSHSGIMLETAKNSIVVLCDELLDKMKEIKERNK